ncbi:hypothetical protein [Rhizorhabdus wittichii]|uniref:hypothetical protein n=1 Tax=Rhizorhabdus wittichii TaxID=160791 RepID=UPI0002E6B3F0|nr:hypothetical protein [Rhizorhabdus wittichii]
MKMLMASAAALLLSLAAPAVAEKPAMDALSRMFLWWDQAFRTPGAYMPEAFSQFFTPDATLTLEGRQVISGLDQWAAHFRKIQAGGGEVEIVVPFKQVFEKDGMIYTYHVIRSRRDGTVACSLAAGHAVLRGGKIAAITLVRIPLDPEKAALEPQCWKA